MEDEHQFCRMRMNESGVFKVNELTTYMDIPSVDYRWNHLA